MWETLKIRSLLQKGPTGAATAAAGAKAGSKGAGKDQPDGAASQSRGKKETRKEAIKVGDFDEELGSSHSVYIRESWASLDR